MKKTVRRILSLFFLTSLVILFSSYMPLASADTRCPCDDLDYCVEWVSEGSKSIKWGQIETMEVNGVDYTFRADDFDENLNAALISIEKGGVVRKEFLFLEGNYDRQWFEWDNEIKVELEDITEDSHKTPSAKIEVFSRGRPELEISFDASSETIDGVDVSSEQYAPGEEKKIDVELKNTGDAWIENSIIEIDIGEFRLKAKGDFEFRDQVIKKNFGCLTEDEKAEMNFTIVAPEWDGKTSPYELDYCINATAGGYDIKEGYYNANNSLSFGCTEPDMKVLLEVVNEEINMTSWYAQKLETSTGTHNAIDYEIRDAWEYSFLRTKIFNTGLYAIDDIEVQFSEVPEDLLISEIYESGSHYYMDANGQYYLGQKLIPIRQGKYSFDKVVVNSNFFGKNFTWSSGSESMTVHGPYIALNKTLYQSGNDYSVVLKLSNEGDRASWINLTDTIPDEVNYVGGSLEKSLEGSDLPLSEWDLSISMVNGTQFVSVKGVLLPPGSTLSLGYDFSSDTTPDLPPAVCEFRSIVDYEGEVQSSYYISGKEFKQYWSPLDGEWVSDSQAVVDTLPIMVKSENSVVEGVQNGTVDVAENNGNKDTQNNEYEEESLKSTNDEQSESNSSYMELKRHSATEVHNDPFNQVKQVVGGPLDGLLDGIIKLFSVVENSAVNAVENYLYVIIIIIAMAVFSLAYILVNRQF